MESYRRNLTGVKDVDLLILSGLDDRDLFNFCQTDQYARRLCQDENFWKQRFLKKYRKFEKNEKNEDRTWKDFYLKITKYLPTEENGWNNFYIDSILKMDKDGLDPIDDYDLYHFFENTAIEFIKSKMVEHLDSVATQGREDDEKEALTSEEFEEFVDNNWERIDEAAKKMYNTYKEEDDMTELINPERDWYSEWLEDLTMELYAL